MAQALTVGELIAVSARLSYRLAVFGRNPLDPFDTVNDASVFSRSDQIMLHADRIRALDHPPVSQTAVDSASASVAAANVVLDDVDAGNPSSLSKSSVFASCDVAIADLKKVQ